MGGLSVYADSIHANINNPASLGELKLTTFSVGVHYKNTQLSTVEAEENVTSSSMDYIAVSIPTKRFGFSFGIMPYSSVGYRLQSFEGLDDETTSDALNRFEGSGGLNRTFVSVGLPLFKVSTLGLALFTTLERLIPKLLVKKKMSILAPTLLIVQYYLVFTVNIQFI